MSRFRWPLLILAVCLPLILLAAGYRLPWFSPAELATPEPVPDGDFEIVWLNTTTSGGAWERFVAGANWATRLVPGLRVDAANAFQDQTTAVPEVVLSLDGRPQKLRIRWYKLSSQHETVDWVRKLAARKPAPLAIIGGSSSDRARELALALAAQTTWQGERPILVVTNATAEKVDVRDAEADPMKLLTGLYPGRTFRVCFSNGQMAEAMLDFVWQNPALRPDAPKIHAIAWDDDPFSGDMIAEFHDALQSLAAKQPGVPSLAQSNVPYSVGGFSTPNRAEREIAATILADLRENASKRGLLVIPTGPTPARRLLQTLCEAEPTLGRRLVAINGDGMGANTVLRDGEYLWPLRAVPVPLVLFTHANPAGWDNEILRKPTSTEDVLHNAEIVRILATAAYENATVRGADELARRLHSLEPPFFDADGNRRGGTGEYILLLTPKLHGVDAAAEVWTRKRDRTWQLLQTLPCGAAR